MKKMTLFTGFLLLFLLALPLTPRLSGQAAPLDEEIPEEEWTLYLPIVLRPSPIANHDFERGPLGWDQYQFPINGFPLLIVNAGFESYATPRSGSWLAWLGGELNKEYSIGQQLTVPVSEPYLTYWYWIDSIEPCGYSFGGVMVNGERQHKNNLEELHNLCEDEETFGWAQNGVDLSAYAGQTITLELYARTGEVGFSHLFIDDLAFTAVP
jgi:hypothetical protein